MHLPLTASPAAQPPTAHCCRSEEGRRQRLLDRRLDLLQMGFDEEFIAQEQQLFDLSRIRHPPGSGGDANLDK